MNTQTTFTRFEIEDSEGNIIVLIKKGCACDLYHKVENYYFEKTIYKCEQFTADKDTKTGVIAVKMLWHEIAGEMPDGTEFKVHLMGSFDMCSARFALMYPEAREVDVADIMIEDVNKKEGIYEGLCTTFLLQRKDGKEFNVQYTGAHSEALEKLESEYPDTDILDAAEFTAIYEDIEEGIFNPEA